MTETEERLRILQEFSKIVLYAGVRADGSINGMDLLSAIRIRQKEIEEGVI